MELPIPVITRDGPQLTAAELDHQRWLARSRPQDEPREQAPIVRTFRTPPSEQELALEHRRRMIPQGDTPAAYQSVLDAIALEKPIAEARVLGCRAQAAEMMTTGSVQEIQAARTRVEAAIIEAERLVAFEISAIEGLARVKAAEAEQLRVLAASVPEARKIVAAFRRRIDTEFPQHARAIAEIVEEEKLADRAMAVLREAQVRLGQPAPATLSRTRQGLPWRAAVVIPGYVVPQHPMPNGEAGAYAHLAV